MSGIALLLRNISGYQDTKAKKLKVAHFTTCRKMRALNDLRNNFQNIEYMKLNSIVELWDDGTYSIYVTNLKKHNLNASGASVEEAKINLQKAISDYTDMYNRIKKPVPKELQNPVFVYKYDIASFFDYFNWINISNFAKKARINPSLLLQYKNKIAFASEKQKEKIQITINQMGKELATVRL